MEEQFSAEHQPVVDLLQKMGRDEATYPADLLNKRRALFLASITAAAAPVAVSSAEAAASSGTIAAGETAAVAAPGAGLLQTVLVTVLVIELALGAYFTRDLWLPLLTQATPTPEAVEVQPYFDGGEAVSPTDTPLPTEIEGAPVIITTPPAIVTETQGSPEVEQVLPTEKENPGKHLGQTPGPPEAPGQDNKP